MKAGGRSVEAVRAALDYRGVRCLPRGELFLGQDFLGRFFGGAEGGYPGRLAAAARSLGLSAVGVDLNGDTSCAFFDAIRVRLEDRFLVGYLNGPVSRLVECEGFFKAMLAVRREPHLFPEAGESCLRDVEKLARPAIEAGFGAVALADDIAGKGGLLFPLGYFIEALLPVYGLVAGVLKGQGLHAFFHSDGDTKKIIGPLVGAGYDCIHPVDGQAGLDLYDLQAEFGGTVTFMGHVDIAGWEEERIVGEIGRAEASFPEGGLILGSSCGVCLATAQRLSSLYPGWHGLP